MRILFELSKEHPSLPEAELYGVFEGEGLSWSLVGRDKNRGLVLIDVKSSRGDFVGRLALAKTTVEVVSVSRNLEEVAATVYPRIRNANSFRIRCGSNTVERELGGLLHEKGLRVNLTKPEKTVVVFEFNGKFAAGFEIPIVKDFDVRHPLKRPFFHPTSMKPKTARVLVNLACVRRGDMLLDPFCGVGGVLLEAGLTGLKPFGWDIDGNMLEGCGKNLRYFGVNAVLEEVDALDRHEMIVDAVVTDPPYGKSSSTLGLSPKELYNRFLDNIKHNVKKGGRLVIVLPGEYKPKHSGFVLKEKFKIRVHKSLTRIVWVFQKT